LSILTDLMCCKNTGNMLNKRVCKKAKKEEKQKQMSLNS